MTKIFNAGNRQGQKSSVDSWLIRTQLDEQALSFGAQRVAVGELSAKNSFAPLLADEPRPYRQFLADGCNRPEVGVQIRGPRRSTVAAAGEPPEHFVE